MSTKRKREDEDIEFSPASKLSKSATEEVTRSGRVRKKPARFKDTEDVEGEEEEETSEDTKTLASPVVISMTPPKVISIPEPITKASNLQANVVTKLVTSPVKEISQPLTTISPQTAKTLLQAKLLEMPKGNIIPPLPPPSHSSPGATTKVMPLQINPQSVQLPTLMVKTALQAKAAAIDVSTSAEMSDGTPKSGRVRKKSAKVLEMEAFEEAERAKHTVKKGVTKPVSSPTSTPPKLTKLKPEEIQQKLILQKTLPVTGVTSPVKAEQMEPVLNTVTVQQALLQLPVMKTEPTTIKNIQDTAKTLASTKKSSKKKKAESSPVQELSQAAPTQIAVVPKVAAAKSGTKSKEVTITGLRSDVDPMLSTSYLPDPSAHLIVKDEPNDGVDLGLLSSETPNINMSAVQKTNVIKAETVTPAKKSKPKAKKSSSAAASTEAEVSLQEEGNKKASSVIKMLLSKPSQYSSPSVSTKTIASEKKSKQQKVAMETELTVDTTVNQSSELKSKLMLSSPDMEDDLLFDDNDDDDEEMYAEEDLSPESSGKKKNKKVKKKQKVTKQADMEDDSIDGSEDWEFETADGNLVIAENVPKSKPKKSPKKAKSGGSDAYMDDSQVGYANSKKGKKTPPASAEKKKKRLTAYTMWCNTVRNKVLNDNPGIDFAQLSRRLGEIWQGLPSKDKMNWKRKAKREARKLLGKGLLITTGKGGSSVSSTAASQVHNKSATPSSSNVQSTQHHQQQQQQHTVAKALTFTKPEDGVLASSTKGVLGTEPVDVAAHLKLLGESLGIIGMRLQEHRGLIAVQGSLSVLLDSLLCALGPLMCLTSQVSEMNGSSSETHARTLDHIAYIMPGL